MLRLLPQRRGLLRALVQPEQRALQSVSSLCFDSQALRPLTDLRPFDPAAGHSKPAIPLLALLPHASSTAQQLMPDGGGPFPCLRALRSRLQSLPHTPHHPRAGRSFGRSEHRTPRFFVFAPSFAPRRTICVSRIDVDAAPALPRFAHAFAVTSSHTASPAVLVAPTIIPASFAFSCPLSPCSAPDASARSSWTLPPPCCALRTRFRSHPHSPHQPRAGFASVRPSAQAAPAPRHASPTLDACSRFAVARRSARRNVFGCRQARHGKASFVTILWVPGPCTGCAPGPSRASRAHLPRRRVVLLSCNKPFSASQ